MSRCIVFHDLATPELDAKKDIGDVSDNLIQGPPSCCLLSMTSRRSEQLSCILCIYFLRGSSRILLQGLEIVPSIVSLFVTTISI